MPNKDSTALSLAYASVGDDGCTAIARYMRENVMLRTLDLRGNNIRADGLVVLAHGLRTGSGLRESISFDVQRNEPGGGNMTSVRSSGLFAATFCRCEVCFKWNQIGRVAITEYAASQENQSITHVDLRNNKIGTDCGPLLGDMLRENCTLTHLDLSWNDLGVEGGKSLLDGLQANHSLIDCQLSGNRLAEASTFRQERAMSPSQAFAAQGEYTPLSRSTGLGFSQHRTGGDTQDPGSPMASPMSPMSAQAPTTPASPGASPSTTFRIREDSQRAPII
ncbi:LRRC45 [Symbiodinium microadriaticum]|nr:LRRC45 [Symbiodinium microadriaticum]